MERLEIHDTLKDDSNAKLQGMYSPVGDFAIARWCNGIDHVSYSGAAHHTLSVYRSGYKNALRADKNIRGVEDSFCLMPAGKESAWSLEGPISFIHFYFDDKSISNIAERVFDKSGRDWQIPDITYKKDKQLILFCQWLLHTPVNSIALEPILTEQNFITIMTYLMGKIFKQDMSFTYRGGLNLRNTRLLRDYIQENLDKSLLLRDLAHMVDLSEFHFQRMFRQSFDMPPHEYINRVRIDRARELIRKKRPLTEIGLETGFSSQPHFTRVFKQYTGITPGGYRRLEESF